MFLTKNIVALIQPMDQRIIQASKAFYHGELLDGVVNYELQIMEFLVLIWLGGKLHQLLLQTARKSVLEKLSQKTS
jgi:hypothetical protein